MLLYSLTYVRCAIWLALSAARRVGLLADGDSAHVFDLSLSSVR